MSESKIELCHIREVTTTDDGFLGLGLNRVYRSNYVANIGDRIIAKPTQVEWKSSEFMGNASKVEKATERRDLKREVAYQEIFQKLMAEGWEPIGTDEKGKFMTFRKTNANNLNQISFVNEIERLSQLKKQGVLSEEEFEAAKRKLLA